MGNLSRPSTPLNQPSLPPHHVPTNLKVLLLVFAIALVVGLGYMVWFQNNLPSEDTADIILKKPVKTATDLTPKSLAYVNNTYGFTVSFNSLWTGYKVKTVVPADNSVTAYLYVNLPTASTDPVWTTESSTNFAGYASVMAFSVFTPAQWSAMYDAAPQQPTKLAENSHYIFTYGPAQAYPDDLNAAYEDIATVIATFKLN